MMCSVGQANIEWAQNHSWETGMNTNEKNKLLHMTTVLDAENVFVVCSNERKTVALGGPQHKEQGKCSAFQRANKKMQNDHPQQHKENCPAQGKASHAKRRKRLPKQRYKGTPKSFMLPGCPHRLALLCCPPAKIRKAIEETYNCFFSWVYMCDVGNTLAQQPIKINGKGVKLHFNGETLTEWIRRDIRGGDMSLQYKTYA